MLTKESKILKKGNIGGFNKNDFVSEEFGLMKRRYENPYGNGLQKRDQRRWK